MDGDRMRPGHALAEQALLARLQGRRRPGVGRRGPYLPRAERLLLHRQGEPRQRRVSLHAGAGIRGRAWRSCMIWPFRKRRRFYINGHHCDSVKHAFEWFGGVFVVMDSGDAYIIKHDWRSEDYEVIRVRSVDGRVP